MNLNIIGYGLYLGLTAVIIIKVGKICYRNGNVFVASLYPDHEDFCRRVNGLLLIGYYLLNLGYCGVTIAGWETIGNPKALVEAVSGRTAWILMTIALMHYLNITCIILFIHKNQKIDLWKLQKS
jgi:hypothetical protein